MFMKTVVSVIDLNKFFLRNIQPNVPTPLQETINHDKFVDGCFLFENPSAKVIFITDSKESGHVSLRTKTISCLQHSCVCD